MPAISTTTRHTAAVLLAPRLAQSEQATLVELEKLLAGLGIIVVQTVVQRATPLGSPHLIGSGKLEELKATLADEVGGGSSQRDVVLVVAADISPSEQRALERALELPVLDRSAIILRVFEERARTTLARLEVSLARARYELPRVRDDSSLGDREGGGGRAARGHTNVALRKQQLRRTIADLERRISAAERARSTQQKARRDLASIALVGYTNAGKSSLMAALSGTDVFVADQLFATLSTTVRTLPGTSSPAVISDTVGFLRELPHELLRSFRSTLMEAVEADLRVVVVDASDPDCVEQQRVTETVLQDLGADRSAELVVFNKVDRLTESEREDLAGRHPDALLVSAHRPTSIEALRRAITQRLDRTASEVEVVVPFSDGKRLSALHEHTRVLKQAPTDSGLLLTVRAPRSILARLGLAGPKAEDAPSMKRDSTSVLNCGRSS